MNEDKQIKGGRNLILLGLSATVIAIISTAASLQIYRSTGDIYLDRSRPGYISEGEKHNEEDNQKENFSNEGEISESVIDEYLSEFDKVVDRIEKASDSFSSEALGDDSLDISVEENED
ncbi:MAG: hypothetical protein MJ154_02170 [Candidatus Saccharibacteria bacterium]|nr:hypothetical protein [Candidatus Saccharibacteria bacterium]